MSQAVVVEPMAEDDLDAVVAIEAQCYRAPWPRAIFAEELGREWGRLVVARTRDENGTRIVGYCNYWIVRDELHLLNIAVAPSVRGAGVGTVLMEHLVAAAIAQSARLITLEVRAGNEAAKRLYARMGFEAVGIRKRYYADNDEDAVVMLREF